MPRNLPPRSLRIGPEDGYPSRRAKQNKLRRLFVTKLPVRRRKG